MTTGISGLRDQMLGPGPANGDSFLGRREQTPKFRSQAEPPLTRAIAPHCGPLGTQLAQKVPVCACLHARTMETHPEAKLESTEPSSLQKGNEKGSPGTPQDQWCCARLKRAFRTVGRVALNAMQRLPPSSQSRGGLWLSPDWQEELSPRQCQGPQGHGCSGDTVCILGPDCPKYSVRVRPGNILVPF